MTARKSAGKGLQQLTAENAAKVLEGRRRALPYATIAAALGVTEQQCRDAFASAIEAEGMDLDLATATQLDLSRLDRMTQGLWADASSGVGPAVDRMLTVMEARRRMLAGPQSTAMADAFDQAMDGLQLTAADGALKAAGRRIAERIDASTGAFDPTAETKAMYLMPHLMNVLRELGATPAARAAVKTAKEEQGGKLSQLRALRAQETEAEAS